MGPDQLLKKRMRAREGRVTVGEHTFTFRRPTDIEAAEIDRGNRSAFDIAAEYVIGWSDTVTEAVLVPGGGSDPVPFHRALWRDWVADYPDAWAPISHAVVEAYTAHVQEISDSGKG